MEIFKLFGRILINNDEADRSISNTENRGLKLGKTLTNVGAIALKTGAVMATGFVAAGGAALTLAKKTGDVADRLLDLNSITGMSTDEIQKWERVTKVAGVNADAMTNASQKLTKTLDTMTTGTGKAVESAEKLGLSYEQLSSMTADERMNAVSTALAEVGDKTERARLGTDLLGGSWKEIAPIVDLGAEAMQKAKDSANIISNDDLVKANDFRIKMAEMGDKIEYVAMSFGVKLLPLAEKFFAWVEKAMPYVEKAIDVTFVVISLAIESVIYWIEQLIEWGKTWLKDNTETTDKIKNKFMEFFQAVRNFFEGFIIVVTDLWARYGDEIVAIIKWAFDLIKNVVSIAFDVLIDLFNIFSALFKGDWESFWKSVNSLLENVLNLWEKLIYAALDGIVLILKSFQETVKLILDKGWNVIKELTSKAWEGVKNAVKGPLDWIMEQVEKVFKAVDRVKKAAETVKNTARNVGNKVKDIGSGVKNTAIRVLERVPGLAEGGTVTSSGLTLVGEEGPELLDLPKGSSVIPLAKQGITINITGNTIMNDRDADKFGNLLVKRLRGLGVNT